MALSIKSTRSWALSQSLWIFFITFEEKGLIVFWIWGRGKSDFFNETRSLAWATAREIFPLRRSRSNIPFSPSLNSLRSIVRLRNSETASSLFSISAQRRRGWRSQLRISLEPMEVTVKSIISSRESFLPPSLKFFTSSKFFMVVASRIICVPDCT